MNWPAALMASGVLCMIVLAAPAIAADDESDIPEQFTYGDFTYFVEAPGEVALTRYTEPADPPSQVRIPETFVRDGVTWTVVAIEDYAFSAESCGEKTRSIYIPGSVSKIGNWSFSSMHIENLEVDSASDHYRSEDGVLFEKHSNTLVRYPPAKAGSEYAISRDVCVIASSAFSDADALHKVAIGENVIFIEYAAFQQCENLEEVSFSGSRLREVGNAAFSGCLSLSSIELPDGLTSIEKSAFSDCRSLVTIGIPSTLTSIGERAFLGCSSLTDFDLDKGNRSFVVEDHALYAVDTKGKCTTLVSFPAACEATELTIQPVDAISPYAFSYSRLTKVTVPFGMTSVSAAAFAQMYFLEEVSLPSSIAKIGSLAFNECTALKSIELGDNVQFIDYGAFMDCLQLKEVSLGQGIYHIDDSAFAFTAIESIVLPESLGELGMSVFWGCRSLSYIQIDSSDVEATGSLDIGEAEQTVTVKCYRGALNDLGMVSDNVVFDYYGERPFPLINLVGIGICALLLLGILNYLRRI